MPPPPPETTLTPDEGVRAASVANSAARDRLIFRPNSWFERLDPALMFSRVAPLEVELGSGDGSFLVSWARLRSEHNHLGVERLLGRIRKLDRKAQQAGLNNVLGLRIEASYCLECLLPPGSVTALHVYFPDPWPKRRHHKNRLINARFVELAHQVLEPAGAVHFRTDSQEYFQEMRNRFNSSPHFGEMPTPEDLSAVMTDFQREFHAAGVPTLCASYSKVG